jgi:hypothetical protein
MLIDAFGLPQKRVIYQLFVAHTKWQKEIFLDFVPG